MSRGAMIDGGAPEGSGKRATASGVTHAAGSLWIVGPWIDVIFIVASPVIVIALLTVARGIWTGVAISSFVMVWAIGHHLPGMMRAYGDPALFRRFRVRFTAAPLLLLGACSFAFLTGVSSGLLAITAIWGWWHYLMQAYGFCRIYDSKVKSFAAPTRWLDQAMCAVWFLAAVVLNDNALYGFIENFYNSGLPVPPARILDVLRPVTRASAAAITVLFIVNLFHRWQQGESPSPVKMAVMVSTFACFWYSAATVTNIVVAYAFFELFHDVQYLTIVWAFNRRRAEKDAHLQGFTRWLFQPRLVFIAIYLAMILGYGSLKWGSTYVSADRLQKFLMAVFLMSTLLHYYFDGFIWKLRDSGTQSSLDIDSHEMKSPPWRVPIVVRHSLLWCLFVVPFVFLSVAQVQDAMARHGLDASVRLQRRLKESEMMVRVVPNSFRARFTLGIAQEYLGDLDAALKTYEETLERCPAYEPAEAGLQRVRAKQRTAIEDRS